MASIADTPFTFIGLDVHKDSISAGVLEPGVDDPTHDKILHDEPSIRRLLGRFDPATLKVCYEAGPTGYGLARLADSMGIDCQVVAPSLIPTAPGDRVKTDRWDARRLARLARAGELTPIRVPSEREDAVRDLCRIRVDADQERRRARQRLGWFLLRHGRVFREAGNWTRKHAQWLNSLQFDEPAAQATFGHYRAMLQMAATALRGIDDDLATWTVTPIPTRWPGWRPIGACSRWAGWCWPSRCATSAGSRPRARTRREPPTAQPARPTPRRATRRRLPSPATDANDRPMQLTHPAGLARV